MASVLESFGIKKNLSSTSIPQLGINSDLNRLQLDSQIFFTLKKDAQADDNQLAIEIKKDQNFQISNTHHTRFLNHSVQLFKEKSTQLKSIDTKILGSIAFGVTATALSFLPVIGFIGWIGWAAAAYFINKRATAYAEYHESLTLLVAVCNWSLGEKLENRKDRAGNLTKNESIREMMAQLYPVLTEAQVRHLIANDIEEVFANELIDYENKYKLGFEPGRFFSKEDNKIALSKKGAEFSRCIYGFNKGGATDFLDAIITVLPDVYRAIVHGFQRFKYWLQESTHSEKEVETSSDNSVTATMK